MPAKAGAGELMAISESRVVNAMSCLISLDIPLAMVVTAANVSDNQGLRLLLEQVWNLDLNLEHLYLLYVDGGYRSSK